MISIISIREELSLPFYEVYVKKVKGNPFMKPLHEREKEMLTAHDADYDLPFDLVDWRHR
jgi:hypothetical protein